MPRSKTSKSGRRGATAARTAPSRAPRDEHGGHSAPDLLPARISPPARNLYHLLGNRFGGMSAVTFTARRGT
jgi:hypothetical protein